MKVNIFGQNYLHTMKNIPFWLAKKDQKAQKLQVFCNFTSMFSNFQYHMLKHLSETKPVAWHSCQVEVIRNWQVSETGNLKSMNLLPWLIVNLKPPVGPVFLSGAIKYDGRYAVRWLPSRVQQSFDVRGNCPKRAASESHSEGGENQLQLAQRQRACDHPSTDLDWVVDHQIIDIDIQFSDQLPRIWTSIWVCLQFSAPKVNVVFFHHVFLNVVIAVSGWVIPCRQVFGMSRGTRDESEMKLNELLCRQAISRVENHLSRCLFSLQDRLDIKFFQGVKHSKDDDHRL